MDFQLPFKLHYSEVIPGQMLNFNNIANDAAIPASTVREYYHILEDTFIGFMLNAWTKTVKRKPVSTAKFYYFDLGVKNALAKIKFVEPKSDIYGQLFEHLIALELRAYLSYRRKKMNFNYWQSKNGQEVDFIIDDRIAIEVKSNQNIQEKHLKGLKALQEENICTDYYLVSQDSLRRKVGNILILHWQDFLDQLWNDKLIL